MAVAITCGYGGYLLPLLAAHSSLFCVDVRETLELFVHLILHQHFYSDTRLFNTVVVHSSELITLSNANS